jgi:hypothetical protein
MFDELSMNVFQVQAMRESSWRLRLVGSACIIDEFRTMDPCIKET